ncbi:uncharacterized protein [Drosophila suzukii]|uniref:Integrase catalytic domain-containing protein n=1 Tax=Drosophila suzukii TaxID=28584 RepID=A0ABM4TVM0_DROSZ
MTLSRFPFPRYTWTTWGHFRRVPRETRVIVDAFTKFTIVRAVKSTATKHVLDVLQDVTSYLGMPDRSVTDRGTAFTSKDFEKYCKSNNVKHILNAVRTPRANGHAERTNRTILSMFLPSNDIDKRWDDNVRSIQWSINTMLLYGYEPRDILKNAITNIIQSQDQKMLSDAELDQLRADAARTVNDHRAAAKKRYDAKHAKPTVYSLGDLVLVENEPFSTGTSRKLEPRYKGPFIINKVLPNDRYLVEDIPHAQRKQRHYKSVYSSDKMKRWCELPPEEPDEDDDFEDDPPHESCEDAEICQERPTVNSA